MAETQQDDTFTIEEDIATVYIYRLDISKLILFSNLRLGI